MAKSSADDEELRRACEVAIEGTKQTVLMSIRVAKSRGIWGKPGSKLGRGQMAKPRVLAISGTRFPSFYGISHFQLRRDLTLSPDIHALYCKRLMTVHIGVLTMSVLCWSFIAMVLAFARRLALIITGLKVKILFQIIVLCFL